MNPLLIVAGAAILFVASWLVGFKLGERHMAEKLYFDAWDTAIGKLLEEKE